MNTLPAVSVSTDGSVATVSVPYLYTVPDLSVTSHVYVTGLYVPAVLVLRTILAKSPSTRVWNVLSAVLRLAGGPRCATGVSISPLIRYVSVSFAESYRGTPHRVSTAIAGTARSQPRPSQLLPPADE